MKLYKFQYIVRNVKNKSVLKGTSKVNYVWFSNKAHSLASEMLQFGSGCTLSLHLKHAFHNYAPNKNFLGKTKSISGKSSSAKQ